MKQIFFTLIVVHLAIVLSAQEGGFYPERNIGYQYTQNRYNPAVVGQDSVASFGVSNQAFVGLFSGIGTQHAFGQGTIKAKEGRHGIGGYVQREKRGPYINRIRIYGQYAYHVKLSGRYYAALGAGIGYFQFNLKASNVAVADSDGALDGHIGTRVYGPRFSGGVALMQVGQPAITPYVTQFYLMRYLNIDAHLTEKLTDLMTFEFHGLGRVGFDDFSDLSLSAGLRLRQLVVGGVNYASQLGVGMYAGLDEMKIMEGRLMFSMFYQLHHEVKSSMLEVVARYRLDG